MEKPGLTERIVIVGAGQAGCQLAVSLREMGFAGAITLLGDEAGPPYQRPPLSKAFLKGSIGSDALCIKPEAYFSERSITFRPASLVEKIDRRAKNVVLTTGEAISYDRLVLATGVRNRMISIPNADAPGIVYLRTLGEADALKAEMMSRRRVVVIGAGFIGMEFAAVARQAGLEVIVVEQADRSMSRAVSKQMSSYVEARHRSEGVRLEFNAAADAFKLDAFGRLEALRLKDGRDIEAELALIAIGVIPNVELAETARLQVRNGILVDDSLTTSDPAIHAIGDCARYMHPLYPERSIRLESVQNAADQARFLAGAIMGEVARYDSVPWFWSDQYDLKLQIAGLCGPTDTAELAGNPASGSFSVRHSADGRMTALETMNQAREHMLARNELKRFLAANADLAGKAPVIADTSIHIKA